jgi:glycosyltransferase involved in cell wall biosynthesis
VVLDKLVGIDASRMVINERTGTETYTLNIVRALISRSAQYRHRLYLNASAAPADLSSQAELRLIPFPRLWTHIRLSTEMARFSPDLLFIPAHVIPLIHPKSVVTIHDLGYLYHPESHPFRQRLLLDKTTRWNARVAAHVIAPSQTTAHDITSRLGVPSERITTIPHGIGSEFAPARAEAIERVRHDHQLHRPYVLAVGTRQPRKNYARLAQAHRALVAEGHDLDLVIAGKRGWLADEVDRDLALAGLGNRLRLLDYVPSGDLCPLYSGAEVVAMPSLYEGFGLPLLEAMAAGAPTVAANNSSLREIAAGASLLFDPTNVHDLAQALKTVVEQEEIRSKLRVMGQQRAEHFTWENAASRTAAVFEQVLRCQD